MARNESPDSEDVSKLSRRGLLTLGATLASVGGLGAFSGTASAHGLMAFRDAFIGNDGDEQGLGSKGWLFFAKDTGNVYYHDGSGWKTLPIGGNSVFSDSDSDGLLEASNHDGIDVGTVETDEIRLGADTDNDGNGWRFDTDSSDTARIYSGGGSTATEYIRFNEKGPMTLNSDLVSNRNVILDAPDNGFAPLRFRNPNTEVEWTLEYNDSNNSFRLFDNLNDTNKVKVNHGGSVEIENSVLSLAHEQSSAPSAPSEGAKLWVDLDDGDLKATFADGTTSTVATK